MRTLTTFLLAFFLTIKLFGQEDKIRELLAQGTALHDQGKYDEAIEKYKAALEIDENSPFVNYELSYTYMTVGNYDEALKFSRKAIEKASNAQEPAYMVLGNSLDLSKKPQEAIKIYEEGLSKYPGSDLLNYNLAMTAYNIRDYPKAEHAAIAAIRANPSHASSHLVLANIMKAKGARVQALLPLYYFLMLEPDSKRSSTGLNMLHNLLIHGIEQRSKDTINISLNSSLLEDSSFGAAEISLSMAGAAKYTEGNKNKTDAELFTETNKTWFSTLGELKNNNSNLWWDLYVPRFYDLVQSNNDEAFSYYISQSSNSSEIKDWISKHNDKMKAFLEWLKK